MSKKTVVVIATSIAGLVLTSSMALALNLGILAETAKETEEPGAVETALEPDLAVAGETGPTPAAGDDATHDDEFSVFPDGAEVITVYVDELVPAPTGDTPATAATSPGAPSTAAPGAQVATPTPTAATPTATPAPTTAAVTYPIHDVGGAGQVALQVSGNSVSFWGAYPGDGWAFMVDEEGPGEVKVEFRKGGQEVEFKAEIENGVVRVKVESESHEYDDEDHADDHDEYDDEYDDEYEDEEDEDEEDEDEEDEDEDDEDDEDEDDD